MPWRTVHELLIAAARSTTHILTEPVPFVLQTSLNNCYVTYEINAYTDQPNRMATIYAELHQHIQDTFNEAGVEVMSPHYTQVRDGNKAAIPDQYLPKSYEAQGLRTDMIRNAFRQAGGNNREPGAQAAMTSTSGSFKAGGVIEPSPTRLPSRSPLRTAPMAARELWRRQDHWIGGTLMTEIGRQPI